ncbi:hypothetical protein [Actinacidiphila oryziradicis]|uniref:hypothetical protein n=1 Tax=Actinacidiphila oryziradicis TaxID=2571141 RepID=UPI001B8029F5|nr:hypothetical protein [Actinacidiphila oryziradicis]
MTTAVLTFALFSLLLAIAPGPDVLLVLRNCLRGGHRVGSATAPGAATPVPSPGPPPTRHPQSASQARP